MLKELIQFAARYYGSRKSYFTPINASFVPPGEIDFAQAVGAGYSSNVLMTPVSWVARNFNSAPLTVEKQQAGQFSPLDSHPALDLLNRPNPWYTGTDLWDATIKSWHLDGNGYWIKIRDGSNQIAELWWVAPSLIEPRDDGPRPDDGSLPFITHYRYEPRGKRHVDLLPEDVVHFRAGIDPENPRKGCSTLKAILREVFTDDEASRYTAFLLKNYGVPGIVVSPTTDAEVTDTDVLKGQIEQRTTGRQRGRPLVLGRPVKVEQFGFEPKKMDLSAIRNVSEERACAAVGISPAIVNFGSGLDATKVGATMREMKRSAWEDAIIPMQSRMADQLDISVLAEFDASSDIRMRFATEDIPALQADGDALATRNIALYRGGVVRRSEARADLGWPVEPADEGFVFELEPQGAAFGATEPKRFKAEGATRREQDAIDNAPLGTPTETQEFLMRSLEDERFKLEDDFASDIERWGERFGDEVALAASGILKSYKPNGSARKQASDDADAIMRRIDFDSVGTDLQTVYESQYVKVAVATYNTVGNGIGLVIGLPDDRSVEIVKLGGTRRGLIDLRKQTRKRLFQELEKAREEGLGVPATERRIRDLVPAGPWKDVKTRSKIIARTEVMNAQRQSLMNAYKDSGKVEQVMIFDNRTGFGDAECTALNGRIVSLAAAQGLASDEHPNGTRSFAPVL